MEKRFQNMNTHDTCDLPYASKVETKDHGNVTTCDATRTTWQRDTWQRDSILEAWQRDTWQRDSILEAWQRDTWQRDHMRWELDPGHMAT